MRRNPPLRPSNRTPKIGKRLKVAIVRSSFYPDLVGALEGGARAALRAAGIPEGAILSHAVPGSFELPLLCRALAERREVQGIIALGVIIEGETHHAAEIARACTDGLMTVQLATHVPISHGVLFVHSRAQAEARSGRSRNRGTEAAEALLAMLAALAEQ